MTSLRTMVLICAAMTLGTAGVASAQDANGDGMDDVTGQPVAQVVPPADVVAPGAYPIAMAQRPLTLPASTLAIGDGGPEMIGPVFSIGHVPGDLGLGLALGASYGIMDDLQIDGRILPLTLSPKFRFGNARVGASYRFVRGNVEVGGRVGVRLNNDPDKIHPGFDLGVPVDVHFGDSARLATGLVLNIAFTTAFDAMTMTSTSRTVVGLEVPLIFAFNATPNVAIGAWSGFQILDFDAAGDSINFPLRIFGGYTVADAQNRPMLDVGGYFGFPFFLHSGGGDAFTSNVWELGAYARFFLFM